MSTYYTGKGDEGSTGVLANTRLPKSDSLIEAIGSIDELNSSIGIALFYTHDNELRRELKLIQNDLFVIGVSLASFGNLSDKKLRDDAIVRVESGIKRMDGKLPELKEFVIPGGSEASIHMHLARAIARRAERNIVTASQKHTIDRQVLAYMNRLSSFLFVAGLYLNFIDKIEEEHPTY